MHLIVTITFNFFITIEFGGDPWYEQVAKNIINRGEVNLKWGSKSTDDIFIDHSMQIGEYKNWRPIGYSFFLIFPSLFDDNYLFVRSILQSILYSFIPLLIYLISNIIFRNEK